MGNMKAKFTFKPLSHLTLPQKEHMAARIDDFSNNAVAKRQITWRPYLTSSASRTPTVVTKDLAVWNPLEYPFDNGYYLYGEVMPVIPPHKQLLPVDSEDVLNKDKNNSSKTTVDQADSSKWWHGAVFVTVAVVVVVQFMIHFLRGPNKRNHEAIMQYQRMPSTTLTASASTASLETIKEPSTPSSSDSLTLSNSFISRYLTDFEHELCLGKGGFGLVFQATNKVDDCKYAIKRIRLPNCDEALEKVKREVKALAKLEHPGIVRYYNSWFEAPPVGWQDDLDAKMYEQGSFCGLPSEVPSFGSGIVMNAAPADEVYKQNGLEQEKYVRRRKKSSTSRSRHSSHNSNLSDDCERINGEIIGIHQLENEAFLEGHEISDSFSIEFASSSNKGLELPKNGFHNNVIKENSASNSIVFRYSDSGQNKDQSVSNIGSLSSSKNTEDSRSRETASSSEEHFTSSHHSLLSRDKHKCQNKDCNADKLSAPLYLFIQMQLCQRESLKDWLKASQQRDHVFCLTVFEQILCAVEYFHDRGLMHRDLKPSNIFFSLDGSVKVGDFGLVTAHTSENNMDTPIKGSLIDDKNHTSQVGTQLYMSPEQMEGKAYSHKVDIFSLGLIFFELFCPFGTQMERIKVMCDVKQRVIPSDFKANMPLQSELVQWLLSATPKARPNATEVKTSGILKQISQRASENVFHKR
ncbi:Eukaryotic translation initiation factor 2-alpha kinase 3 [Desmophyllum pertusum]|uniref:non-specific serine/threonine protein kinase n=1 Tax=Desmophyllum pertusum TaxID=174260 RepID=A0A9X0CTN5_9CNID|nr:Eukaryotic translation initiation factor 2-alpha kinase 3 [Desmophyllum pertusum]